MLWVGVDDPEPEDAPSTTATAQQSWAGLGAQRKDEMLSVPCTARASSGDSSFRALRAVAFEIFAAVETIVRANASLGGTILVTLPGIDNVRVRQVNGPKGIAADVAFEIVGKARI